MVPSRCAIVMTAARRRRVTTVVRRPTHRERRQRPAHYGVHLSLLQLYVPEMHISTPPVLQVTPATFGLFFLHVSSWFA
jgi:hypothetical protein